MVKEKILLNCDMGEKNPFFPPIDDALLIPYIDLCNIACGGHAGDSDSMKDIISLATRYKKKIGAHPGFPDKKNFGRQRIPISNDGWKDILHTQLSNFLDHLATDNNTLHHVKLHGAMYHMANEDDNLAQSTLEVVRSISPESKVIVFPGSALHAECLKIDHPYLLEGFADRVYTQQRKLKPRQENGALITDPEIAVENVGKLLSHDHVQTLCVHGDNPAATLILKKLWAM